MGARGNMLGRVVAPEPPARYREDSSNDEKSHSPTSLAAYFALRFSRKELASGGGWRQGLGRSVSQIGGRCIVWGEAEETEVAGVWRETEGDLEMPESVRLEA